ncbi:MAG: hypothetical protein ISR58_11225 [Anaerolineales bacterium]|nr:hypothetical protein [Chloroflexota bacterium]MBL6981746.1 hypothetical protein [Anaerolineales bacterium]
MKQRFQREISKCQHGLILLFCVVLLSACTGQNSAPTATPTIYIPPTVDTLAIQLQETEAAKFTAESLPTPTPACKNDLEFIEDLTIEDGTVVSPGQRLDKRWKVLNAGSCNWGLEYEVQLVAGPAMDVPITQALFPAISGTEAEIRMVFTAPDEPGSYRSAWQAYDPEGKPFGESFFIDIVVSE